LLVVVYAACALACFACVYVHAYDSLCSSVYVCVCVCVCVCVTAARPDVVCKAEDKFGEVPVSDETPTPRTEVHGMCEVLSFLCTCSFLCMLWNGV
jgi:hypothetical protein